MTPETILFLVHNGGDYSAYAVLALFTDKTLADEYAKAADGVVEEWPANVPKEKWLHATGRLTSKKIDGRWDVKIVTSSQAPFIGQKEVSAELGSGSYNEWGKPDPETNQYTYGYSTSIGQSEEECRKMCADAFWKLVAELE